MRIFHPIFVLLTLFLASKLSAQVENAIAPPEVNDAQRFFENARIQTELNELSEAQDNYLDGIDLLIQENVSEIFTSNLCTYGNPDHFFSARRLGINSGRISSCIWIDKS